MNFNATLALPVKHKAMCS